MNIDLFFMLFVEKNMAQAWGERTARNCVYFLKTQNDYGMIENLTFQNRKGKTLDLN